MDSLGTATRLKKGNQQTLAFVEGRKRCCKGMAYVDRTTE